MSPVAEPSASVAQVRRAAPWAIAVGLSLGALSYASLRPEVRVLVCAPGLAAMQTRCCAEGQSERDGRCEGEPGACPFELSVTKTGCVAPIRRVEIEGGSFDPRSLDWEAAEAPGQSQTEAIVVAPFSIDAFEVTRQRWTACERAGACPAIDASPEPGRPVVGVSVDLALRFCDFEGGALPTPEQLAWAAAGDEARRYPWGPTGAVCRRAAWGRVRGPCAHDAAGPELAGAFPDGATPNGIHDLAGNVAEWTRSADGSRVEVRGGSFRDDGAAALRTWSARSTSILSSGQSGQDDVGFRCVYPPEPRSD